MIVNETAIHHRPKTSKQIKSLWRLLIPPYLKTNCHIFFILIAPHLKVNVHSITKKKEAGYKLPYRFLVIFSLYQTLVLERLYPWCFFLNDNQNSLSWVIFPYNIEICHLRRQLIRAQTYFILIVHHWSWLFLNQCDIVGGWIPNIITLLTK